MTEIRKKTILESVYTNLSNLERKSVVNFTIDYKTDKEFSFNTTIEEYIDFLKETNLGDRINLTDGEKIMMKMRFT